MKYALKFVVGCVDWLRFIAFALRAKLEVMAAEEDKGIIIEHSRKEAVRGGPHNSEPLDCELFAGEVREEISEREAFAGGEDFYRFLADYAQTNPAQEPAGADQYPLRSIRRRSNRFSMLQKVLAAGIIVIGTMLLYVLLKPLLLRWLLTDIATDIVQQTPVSKSPVQDVPQVEPQQMQGPPAELPPAQPLSLKVAQDFYSQKDYDKAYDVYNRLHQSLPASAEEELPKDFLQLRMALCLKNTGDSDRANGLFKTLLQSRSPVVRLVASHQLSLFEIDNKQYLKARARAYQTIAIIGALDPRFVADESAPVTDPALPASAWQSQDGWDSQAADDHWILSLQRDCHFLIAESMTRNVLSLCDADTDLPGKLWGSYADHDPFSDLNEAQLRYLLNTGSDQLKRGLLGPQIRKFERQGASHRWSVVCHGASIEELLTRFAANAGLDITWAYSNAPPAEEGHGLAGTEISAAVRKRPVSLSLPAVTAQQFMTVAAGHVGLLARPDGERLVNIYNPTEYSSLSEHISLLIQETISVWQRFLLTFHNDQRVPNTHFALGLLRSQEGRISESIAEYKLVANRFSQTSLAPFALLNSSRLKANLRDYAGAREDLVHLVEQYPDTELYGRACSNLADTTMKAGLVHEAGRLYRKVHYLGLSLESRAASALGAGRCAYEEKDYEGAAKWLVQYIKLAGDGSSRDDLHLAYFLLGKSNLALGKLQQAGDAFQSAFDGPSGHLTRKERMEAVAALVETKIQLEDLVGALIVLEDTSSWQLSSEESVEILLLKTRVLRSMGLVDKAVMALGERAEYLPESQLKVRMSFELAECYIAKGDLELARGKLAEILVKVEPGFLANEIALRLAEVCLELDQNSQAVSISLQLLDSDTSEPISQKALEILAAAYNRQKDYNRAALALLGRWQGAKAPSERKIFDSSAGMSR